MSNPKLSIDSCLLPDHDIHWGGDGYFCSKCNQQFVSTNLVAKEVVETLENLKPVGRWTEKDIQANINFYKQLEVKK